MPPEIIAGRLQDILQACRHIEEDLQGVDLSTFAADRRSRQLVERNLEIVGEAINAIREIDPQRVQHITSYQRIIDLRNLLIHGYAAVKHDLLYRTVKDNLPLLLREAQEMLDAP